jgi:chromatin segregation and condensation protein Rec8/ScpA/Scc1 (kleisin family)
LLKEQRLYNEQLQQRQWAHDEDVLEQKHKNKLAEIKARGTQKIKEIGERYNNQINKFNNAGAIVFDGIDYTFDKARNTNVISAILPIVRKYFTEENGYLGMLSGIEESVMSEWGKFYETSRMVLGALGDFRNEFSDDDRENIVRVLTEYSNSRKIANAPKGKDTTITPVSSEQMYEHIETGERVPKSEWDNYRPSKKESYKPVTA